MSEEKQELLKEYLATSGIIAPIVVQVIDGEIYLVDGKHRVDELIAAGTSEIDAAVVEGSMVDLMTRNLFLDHVRGDHQVKDMIRVLKYLFEEQNLGVEDLEQKTGLTRSYIEKILKVGQASPSVLEALDQGVIGVSHAFEISRLPHPIQQEELLAKQALFKWPVKELAYFVTQVLSEMESLDKEPPPVVQHEPAEPHKYNCEGCKLEAEYKYLRPVLLCPNCFGAVWRLGKEASALESKVAEE